MIIVIIGIVCVVTFIILSILDKHIYLPTALEAICAISLILSIFSAVLFSMGNIVNAGEAGEVEKEYEEILLYVELAENYDDPIAIYKINEKVNEWNQKVDEYYSTKNNPIFSWCMIKDKMENCDYIEPIGG